MQIKKCSQKQQGFTLIEVVVVLVLVGILTALAGSGFVIGVRGYLMATENAAITQKAELALSRLAREIRVCHDCSGSGFIINNSTGQFTYETGEVNLGARRLEYDDADGELRIGPLAGTTRTLVDGLSAFSLRFETDGRIAISFSFNHQQSGSPQVFETMVLPRNTEG